ncbi:glycosyltransferase [Actinoplanes subglobosus]|uniref:Glycosyltransferase n=1 Tax=Actinoplanes subglobosus TaxID=1547892 RepID=A0ABV8ILB9_9ACTN
MSVVIPLDSVTSLPLLFAGLPPVGEIILVVGPDEDTVLPLPRAARVIRQTRHGAGNAIACGVAAATGSVVVTLPGDGSCDPADLPRLVEALGTTADQLIGEGADVAEGVRDAGRTDLVLLWFMSVLLGCRPSAAGTGFRAFRRERADRLGLPPVAGTDPARGDGREVEALLAARCRMSGLRVAEVPVEFYPQRGGAALPAALAAIVRERLALRHDTDTIGAESIVVLTGGTSRAPSTATDAAPTVAAATGPDRRVPRPRPAGPDRTSPTGPDHAATAGFGGPDRPGATPSGSPNRSGFAPFGSPGRSGFASFGGSDRPGFAFFAGTVNAPRRPGADHRPTDPALRRWPAPNRVAPTNLDHPNSAGIGMTERRRGSERRGPDRRRTDTTPDRRATAGRPGNDRPNADSPNRRRWRDGQTDLNIGRRPNLRVINGEGSGSGGTRGHLRSV